MQGLTKQLTEEELAEAIALWLSIQLGKVANVELLQIKTQNNPTYLKAIGVKFDLEVQPVQIQAHIEQKQLTGTN